MKLVFDIGCNMGEFGIAVHNEYPDCEIIAVDANALMENYNKRRKVIFLSALMTASMGENKPFYISDSQTGVSTAEKSWMTESRFGKGSNKLPPNNVVWNREVSMPTLTLDHLVDQYGVPDFIKIDVEGHEAKVLEGLTVCTPKLCFEWVEEDTSMIYKCVDHLLDLGYNRFGVIGYFEDKVPWDCTHSDKGDPYMEEPKKYHTWANMTFPLNLDRERRVSYGMFYAKKSS